MCDTLIATKNTTTDQASIFAKNSDRPPNEAQYLVQIPAKNYASGDQVKCTYISIPQVNETHAVLLSKPYWMWGAEIGVNEHGLAIGNEAVFTKIKPNKEPALLGMDLLRLALERAVTPQEAISVITDLLEQHGQGGNCVHTGKLYYHNSFIIANTDEAWVLETIDKQWAAHQIDQTYSISNVLSLTSNWDKSSDGILEQALQHKLTSPDESLNLTQDYSDFIYTTFGKARQRCSRSGDLLAANRGSITVQTMADILRDHGEDQYPQDDFHKVNICMHVGFGPIKISQSTASMIVHLGKERPTVFATGTSAPCTGIFKPFWVDVTLPDMGPNPTNQYDPDTLFWSHERLHRAVMQNYADRIETFSSDRNNLEEKFIKEALSLAGAGKSEREEHSAKCLQQANIAQAEWLDRVLAIPKKITLRRQLHNLSWNTDL